MRIGSLFSGAGGLDLGVQAVFGGTVVWHAEIDKAASKVLAHHWPDVPNLGDVSDINWDSVPPVDVLCGGFPCQDVSAAGRRAGIKEGTRSGLWSVFAEAIDWLHPRIVVIENVRGLLSAAAERTVDDGDSLEFGTKVVGNGSGRPLLRAAGAVLGDLADLRYDAQWATVAAADIGAPHRRERVFIVATATDAGNDGRSGETNYTRGRESDVTGRFGGCEPGGRRQAESSGPSGADGVLQGLAAGALHINQGCDAADSPCDGWDEGRPEPAGLQRGFDVAVRGDGHGVDTPLLPTPCAQQSGNSPEEHLRHKPGRKVVTDLAILVENGLIETGGALLPTPRASDPASASSRSSEGFRPRLGEVVRQLNVQRGPESVDVGVGEDDGSVPVLPTDGGGQHSVVVAGNGEGVAVNVGDGIDGHNAFLPVGLAGTKQEPALLPTRSTHDKTGARSPESIAKMEKPFSNLNDTVVNDLLPTPNASDASGGGAHPDNREGHSRQLIDYALLDNTVSWNKYAPAIYRWRCVINRVAPPPTEPNKNGNPRLNAAFSEWLMGWPDGWVTDPNIGISRNDQLRIIGNGVCPQQAAYALNYLMGVA